MSALPLPLPFIKMHGSGNDFLIIPAHRWPKTLLAQLTPHLFQHLADRRLGVAFDQCVVIGPIEEDVNAVSMKIYNADGSISATCGNVSRCVGRLWLEQTGADCVTIYTDNGPLKAWWAQRNALYPEVTVTMGHPYWTADSIPIDPAYDPNQLPLLIEALPAPLAAIGMGNPHVVFVVEDVAEVRLAEFGPIIEHHPLFPNRTNVEFIHVIDKSSLKMRVWERGAGETAACGSGAAAAAVIAIQRGLVMEHDVSVHMPGGVVQIGWQGMGHPVTLTGPTAWVYEGDLSKMNGSPWCGGIF